MNPEQKNSRGGRGCLWLAARKGRLRARKLLPQQFDKHSGSISAKLIDSSGYLQTGTFGCQPGGPGSIVVRCASDVPMAWPTRPAASVS